MSISRMTMIMSIAGTGRKMEARDLTLFSEGPSISIFTPNGSCFRSSSEASQISLVTSLPVTLSIIPALTVTVGSRLRRQIMPSSFS